MIVVLEIASGCLKILTLHRVIPGGFAKKMSPGQGGETDPAIADPRAIMNLAEVSLSTKLISFNSFNLTRDCVAILGRNSDFDSSDRPGIGLRTVSLGRCSLSGKNDKPLFTL
jgi:hypothetical protein